MEAAVLYGTDREREESTLALSLKRKRVYQSEIQKMMFTFGDARNTNVESSELMEDIIRQHTIDVVREAARGAYRRGGKLALEDLVFLLRKDRTRLRRLQEFLNWKDVRKKLHNATDRQAEDTEVIEDEGGAPDSTRRPLAKSRVSLNILDDDTLIRGLLEGEEEENDTASPDGDDSSKYHLRAADKLTQAMSHEQYMDWSECRQASFTYKKGKKFRDWCNFTSHVEFKVTDEVIDVLGFLAWETLGLVTLTALQVKHEMEGRNNPVPMTIITPARDGLSPNSNKADEPPGGEVRFERSPIHPVHIREAMRRLAPPLSPPSATQLPMEPYTPVFVSNQPPTTP